MPEHAADLIALVDSWRAQESAPRQGWGFSALRGRVSQDEPPWDLDALWREAIGGAASVLDMGTGGGEFLASFAGALPPDTVATEGWPPNLPVATARLAAHGVDVVRYDCEAVPARPMPFPDGRFDLVLNRHESFDAEEVARVLRAGGVFLTQQVGGDDFPEAHAIFGTSPQYPDWTLEQACGQLRRAGLRIEDEAAWHGNASFLDVGSLVYYFTIVTWDVPDDFSVDAYAETLIGLHEEGPARGLPVTFTQSRFWLRALKPG